MTQMKFNINSIVRENVKNLAPYSSARGEYVSDGSAMIFLDANENPFENGVNRYPDPQQRSVKSVLAAQKGVPQEQILLGNGSDEVLDLIFRAFCEPKSDNIISLPPTYGMYKVLSGINTIENREVLLTSNFEPDVNAILSAVDSHTKILFLCSPNNQTGNSFSTEHIEELLERFSGLVVLDEAYIDFSSKASWVERLNEFSNLMVTQTLSKAYGLAGIRLGVCYAHAATIAILNKIKPPYNVNELTQQRALVRIRDVEGVQNEVKQILEERTRLTAALEKIICVKRVYDTDANFILVKVDDANRRYKELLEQGVVVRNRTTQAHCENALRFTVGTPNENRLLIQALQELK